MSRTAHPRLDSSIVVGLLTVLAFWTLCALVAHRQNLRRERRGL